MCTVVLDLRPGAARPLLLLAVRDEFVDRPFLPPGAHWPEAPGIVGGLDLVGGGTWLALDPARPRLAALTNRAEPPVPGSALLTRGRLPLRAVVQGAGWADGLRVQDHAPFNLLLADPEGAHWWCWDGQQLRRETVQPGVHVLGNRGLDAPDDPKQAHWLPRLRAAARPDGGWEDWDRVLDDQPPPDDPRALLVRRTVEDRVHASVTALRVALAPGAVEVAHRPQPLDGSAWEPVALTS